MREEKSMLWILLCLCLPARGTVAFIGQQRIQLWNVKKQPYPPYHYRRQHEQQSASFMKFDASDQIHYDDFNKGAIKLKSMPKLERQVAGRLLDEEAAEMLKEDSSNWGGYLDLVNEWARLGRAENAQEFYDKVAARTSESMPSPVRMAFYRSLLHAWSNRLQLVKNSPLASETATEAKQILEQMAEADRDDTDGSDTLMDPADFTRIVSNYLDLTPLNLTAAFDTWKLWQDQPNLPPPTPQTSAKIIRCVANQEAKNWEEAMESADMAMKLGSSALSALARRNVNGASDKQQDKNNEEGDTARIHNALLELWSKVLPPPAKQKTFAKFPIGDQERTLVGERTQALILEMEGAGIQPNMQTFATIIYAYCKCGWLKEAWQVWKEWKEEMMNWQPEGEGLSIDARSLQMLIQSSLIQAEVACDVFVPQGELSPLQYAELATAAAHDMWALYDRGFQEMKPDVDLYGSLLRCWACPRLKSVSLDSTRLLVDDLLQRSSDPSLQPDASFFSAWQSVVRSHFGNTTISVAEQAGFLVNTMEHQSMDCPAIAPDTSVYNFLIDACLSDDSQVGVTRAEQTVEKMMEAPSSSKKSPNGRSFASIIRAWLKFDTSRAEHWLDRMEERFVPSSALFQEVVLQCCEETKTLEDSTARRRQAERARRLLNRMEVLSKVTSNTQLLPDVSLYSSVDDACERCGFKTEGEATTLKSSQTERTRKEKSRNNKIKSEEDLVRLMKEFGMPDDDSPEANTLTCNFAIAQIANSGKANAGLLAEGIFDYMLDQYVNSANVQLKPDIVTFNSVILAYSKSAHRNASVKAEAFLRNLRNLHISGILLDVEPDVISYNTVIAGYQRSRHPNSGEGAERVFRELLSLYESTQDKRYQPDVVSLCSLLGAYAVKGDSQRAEELLLHFWKEHKLHHSQVAPDTTCFDQVLRAWAKTGKEQGAARAEVLLELMEDMASTPKSVVRPTTTTYNIVLHALANSRDMGAPVRAQELLDRMKAGGRKQGNLAWPDTVTYTTAIAVMCRLAGRQALEMIDFLMEEALNAPDVKINSDFFANVLSSLAFCGNHGAIDFAQDLVENRMPLLGVEPDTFVWNALLNCYAKRGMGEEAEAVLERLEAGSLQNIQTYGIVLDAYAKQETPGSIARAETIIQRMQESTLFKPDAKAYTALIQKYARSNLPLKAKRAQAVLQRMKEGALDGVKGMMPTVITYNALLNACEYTNATDLQEKEEAFTVACLTFDEVQKVPGLEPTHATYGTFLGVVARLMPRSEARNEIAELVFKRCCKEGQVSQYVLRKLKTAISLSQYRQMLGGRREDRLPRKWKNNVKQRRNEGGRAVGRRQNRNNSRAPVNRRV